MRDGFSSCFGLGGGWVAREEETARVRHWMDVSLVNSGRTTHLELALRAAAVEVLDSNTRVYRVLCPGTNGELGILDVRLRPVGG